MTGRVGRGFQLANLDVGLLADPKLLKLVALIPEDGERACTILVYLQTVLRSWQEGRRLSAEEAEGLWSATTERMQALEAARLIDEEHRVSESAWERFYVPALERFDQRSKAGRKGGKASAKARKQRSSGASAKARRRSTKGEAAPNLTPADPPSPQGEAGGGRVGQRALDAPTRPPVRMDRLEDADIGALELMRRELPMADGRRRLLEAEIAARRVVDPGGPSDLTAQAEAAFEGLGATWLARAGRERGPDHA